VKLAGFSRGYLLNPLAGLRPGQLQYRVTFLDRRCRSGHGAKRIWSLPLFPSRRFARVRTSNQLFRRGSLDSPCLDLRMAVRTVAALFPFFMETIRTGYWKISSRAAIWLPVSKISSSNAESNLGRISLNVVEKKGMRIALLIAGVGLRNPSGDDQASN
jgi:hypothetical protein